MSLSLKDFQPINHWDVDVNGEKFDRRYIERGTPKFIIDASTGKRYLNESTVVIRIKCGLLVLGTPLFHVPSGIGNIAYRAAIVFTGYHFWSHKRKNKSFSANCLATSRDGLRIIAQPFSIIGLEAASIYGIFNPHDGRKLYASIEKAQYGSDILAGCFQPKPKQHFFGGDINLRDAY